MSSSTKKKSFASAQNDQQNSTFKQIIYLANGKQFIGYSKKLGYNEKSDKIGMLKNWILRMYSTGYLQSNRVGTKQEIEEIHYFIKHNFEQPIFKLGYKAYEVLDMEWCSNNFAIIQFLDKFYHLIVNNRENEISRLYEHKKRTKSDPLSLDNKRFLTIRSLENYIKDCLEKKNASQGELTNFYHKYITKFNIK